MPETIREDYALVTVEERTFQVTAEYAHFDETNTPNAPDTGGGVVNSQHDFVDPSTLWIVNHSLGNPRPFVVVEDDILGPLFADIDYVNSTTIHVHHAIARTGVVYLTG